MDNNKDEGQEVDLIQTGLSFTSHRPINKEGFHKWVKLLEPNMPTLIEEHKAAQVMGQISNAFLDRYLVNPDFMIDNYVFIDSSVLTLLTRGVLRFDNLVQVTPKVDHLIETIGFCPVIRFYHKEDYTKWATESGLNGISKPVEKPYLGRILIITFDELFYQPS